MRKAVSGPVRREQLWITAQHPPWVTHGRGRKWWTIELKTADSTQVFDNYFWNRLYDLDRGNISFPNYFLRLVIKIPLPPLGFPRRKKAVRGPDVLVSKKKKKGPGLKDWDVYANAPDRPPVPSHCCFPRGGSAFTCGVCRVFRTVLEPWTILGGYLFCWTP